jgi:hypothetical protein
MTWVEAFNRGTRHFPGQSEACRPVITSSWQLFGPALRLHLSQARCRSHLIPSSSKFCDGHCRFQKWNAYIIFPPAKQEIVRVPQLPALYFHRYPTFHWRIAQDMCFGYPCIICIFFFTFKYQTSKLFHHEEHEHKLFCCLVSMYDFDLQVWAEKLGIFVVHF